MMIRLLILILIVGGSLSSANADSLLATADGKWRGSGWFRKTVDAPKQATKCALALRFAEDRKTLSISGRCAGGGRSAKITGRIVEKSAREYAGRWASTGGFSASDMSGKRSGNRIVLHWRAKPVNSPVFERYSAHWTISRGRISISFFGGPAGQNSLSNLILQR